MAREAAFRAVGLLDVGAEGGTQKSNYGKIYKSPRRPLLAFSLLSLVRLSDCALFLHRPVKI